MVVVWHCHCTAFPISTSQHACTQASFHSPNRRDQRGGVYIQNQVLSTFRGKVNYAISRTLVTQHTFQSSTTVCGHVSISRAQWEGLLVSFGAKMRDTKGHPLLSSHVEVSCCYFDIQWGQGEYDNRFLVLKDREDAIYASISLCLFECGGNLGANPCTLQVDPKVRQMSVLIGDIRYSTTVVGEG